jgi:amidase
MFEDCLANAAALDDYIQRHGKPKGPLHGLPISVKEHIFLSGTPSTSGFVSWADDISETDALVIQILRDAGAVFHVKTTNPQGLMVSNPPCRTHAILTMKQGVRDCEQTLWNHN